MKKICLRICVTLLLKITFINCIYAQSIGTDTTLTAQQLKTTKAYYTKQIADQSRLLNGVKYVPNRAEDSVDNAYYLGRVMRNANLNYDDAQFYNIPILFDIQKELVVIKYSDDEGYISLINSKLDNFIVDGHTFIKVIADSTEKVIKSGFYDLVYNGPTTLLVKRYKLTDEIKVDLRLRIAYLSYNDMYINKGGAYYKFSGKKALLKILKDKKSELDKYARANNLSFDKQNLEQSIVKLTAYYDQLTR